jgi:thiamine biosynthesis lipoprotein
MRDIRLVMGMPAQLVVEDQGIQTCDLEHIFAGLTAADAQFSPFKPDSEISRLNRGEIGWDTISPEMHDLLQLCELSRRQSRGYFDIRCRSGTIDLCGIAKGWAIARAARQLGAMGFANFCVEIAGDMQCSGCNREGTPWRIGIRNPFALDEIVKIVRLSGCGVATSGNYLQKRHIYNPHAPDDPLDEIVSLTVIGPDIMAADAFATAAFAMGRAGLEFIESMPGLEGYEIDAGGMARMTGGLAQYLAPSA